jgi:UPF0755 protein
VPRGNPSRVTSERTAEERERAREERARRRAPGAAPDPPPAPPRSPPLPAPGRALNSSGPPPAARIGAGRLGPPRAPAEADPASPAAGAPRRRLTRARVSALLALAAAAALVWFAVSVFQPFAGAGSGSLIVEIPKGASASRIGSILARRGVVSSAFFFDVRALIEGKRGHLHSGRYQLKHDMSYAAAIAALSKPPPAVIAVRVVIPEGYTRQQIATLARADALGGSYLEASRRSPVLDPARYGAPSGTPNLEGFLFPATYDESAGAPVARLVRQQLAAFLQRFGPAEARRARALHVTPYQLLTVASMIEREAESARDRPLIAAVIYNRLRRGMPLAVDATIYYALSLKLGAAVYGRELTTSELQVDSPYNTRLHAGLPPTPIANPGLPSIEAAAHPANAPYLYYVAAPDGCGEHVFSTTYAQFQANAAAYQAAVRRNGGRLPTCKRR